MDPDYEEPTVTLSSFRAMPSEGGIPTFEIGLHVLNPNASPFRLEGVVYTVSIQGHDVVKGVGKDFPVLEGYSEQTIKLRHSQSFCGYPPGNGFDELTRKETQLRI